MRRNDAEHKFLVRLQKKEKSELQLTYQLVCIPDHKYCEIHTVLSEKCFTTEAVIATKNIHAYYNQRYERIRGIKHNS